ncbi:SCO family protein [Steroidobacter sp. S1-65]|uniref:SCO family protein n=1 Tax=Steroidobacter gossypii TaxID=2805490 RepID=A0ABS1WXE7_9GAMM|nr:SCO family protein [Steroidobacter gossypii]MBM0105648.1 SCO family protein [Steroidobacter gossypii]
MSIGSAIAAALLWSICAVAADRPALKAGVFEPPRPAPELSLEASTGGTLSLADYRDKVVLLGFGFTSCPEVCPTTLAVLAQARKRLGAQADQVQVVYVTVDPQRDTAERMRAYLKGFDPTFLGGTGTPAQLEAVRKNYGVMAERKNIGNSYTVGHSSSVYLIDRKGLLRAMMPYGRLPDDYVHDLRVLLSE